MPQKLVDLGKVSCPPMSCCASDEKPRKHYPSLYLCGDQVPAVNPDDSGEFYFIAKARVQGIRNPTDGEPSMDCEVLGMAPLSPADAAKLVTEPKKEAEPESKKMPGLRDSMAKIMMGGDGEDSGDTGSDSEEYD